MHSHVPELITLLNAAVWRDEDAESSQSATRIKLLHASACVTVLHV